MTEIKLDASSVQSIVQKAILDSISQESRDLIIAKAVENLTKPTETARGWAGEKGPSILQQAFDVAVGEAARRLVAEQVAKNSEVKARLDAVIGDVLGKIAEEDSGLLDAIGTAVAEATTLWIRERRGY